MESFENLSVESLLRQEGFACKCGKHHDVTLRFMRLGDNAISMLPETLDACGAHTIRGNGFEYKARCG